MSPLDFLFALLPFLRRFDEGRIFLTAGVHAYKIPTRAMPVQVWVSEESTGNLPVCVGGYNQFGVELADDGFILHADIQSDTASVTWQADVLN